MGNVDAGMMVEGQYLTLGGGRALEARQRHSKGTPAGARLDGRLSGRGS